MANQAVFECPKCQKVRHSSLLLCLRFHGEAEESCAEGAGGEGYWDSLSDAQEVWALRKIGYFEIGHRA